MESADDLIMQQGGTSDLDRAKRIINKLQHSLELEVAASRSICADMEKWRSLFQRDDEILKRLFEGSCYGCPCLAACEEDGLAWDAYNIGCVAREDCLGAK